MNTIPSTPMPASYVPAVLALYLSLPETPIRTSARITGTLVYSYRARAAARSRVRLPAGLAAQTDPAKGCAAAVADPLPGLLPACHRGTARRSCRPTTTSTTCGSNCDRILNSKKRTTTQPRRMFKKLRFQMIANRVQLEGF